MEFVECCGVLKENKEFERYLKEALSVGKEKQIRELDLGEEGNGKKEEIIAFLKKYPGYESKIDFNELNQTFNYDKYKTWVKIQSQKNNLRSFKADAFAKLDIDKLLLYPGTELLWSNNDKSKFLVYIGSYEASQYVGKSGGKNLGHAEGAVVNGFSASYHWCISVYRDYYDKHTCESEFVFMYDDSKEYPEQKNLVQILVDYDNKVSYKVWDQTDTKIMKSDDINQVNSHLKSHGIDYNLQGFVNDILSDLKHVDDEREDVEEVTEQILPNGNKIISKKIISKIKSNKPFRTNLVHRKRYIDKTKELFSLIDNNGNEILNSIELYYDKNYNIIEDYHSKEMGLDEDNQMQHKNYLNILDLNGNILLENIIFVSDKYGDEYWAVDMKDGNRLAFQDNSNILLLKNNYDIIDKKNMGIFEYSNIVIDKTHDLMTYYLDFKSSNIGIIINLKNNKISIVKGNKMVIFKDKYLVDDNDNFIDIHTLDKKSINKIKYNSECDLEIKGNTVSIYDKFKTPLLVIPHVSQILDPNINVKILQNQIINSENYLWIYTPNNYYLFNRRFLSYTETENTQVYIKGHIGNDIDVYLYFKKDFLYLIKWNSNSDKFERAKIKKISISKKYDYITASEMTENTIKRILNENGHFALAKEYKSY